MLTRDEIDAEFSKHHFDEMIFDGISKTDLADMVWDTATKWAYDKCADDCAKACLQALADEDHDWSHAQCRENDAERCRALKHGGENDGS